MSVALYIVAEKEIEGFDLFVNGKAVGRSNHMEKLAKKAGFTPLMDMVSHDPEEMRGLIEDAGGDPDEMDIPEEQWFPAKQGLDAVVAHIEYLQKNPKAINNTAEILDDLREFETVLKRLVKEKVRFHFAIDI
jgi:hypothetical protein